MHTDMPYDWWHLVLPCCPAGDSFQPLLLELFGAAWYTSRTAIIVAVGCGAMLPLCFRTRLGALKGGWGRCACLG